MDWGYIGKKYVYNTKIGFLIEIPKGGKEILQSKIERFAKNILEKRQVQNVLIDLNGALDCEGFKIFFYDFLRVKSSFI